MKKRNKNAGSVAYFCVILILVLAILYSGLQILESTVLHQGQEEADPHVSKTITREGVEYFPRQDITVVMVVGVDQYGPAVDSGSYINPGAADMVALAIIDETNENIRVLALNRDTMLNIPVLGITGRPAGEITGQLALSHTYGSGLEDSCENTRTTVSNFLYGINIDYYVAMNMDAIGILNDSVGGVTVTVTEDFSEVDPTIGKGRVTLMSDQALNYVRTRKDVGNQLNLSRMDRQKDYITSFVEAFSGKVEENDSFAVSTYEAISPYLVSDLTVNSLTGMMERYAEFPIEEIVSPEGENVLGEEYFEFYVDEEKLDTLILRLFYAPKQ